MTLALRVSAPRTLRIALASVSRDVLVGSCFLREERTPSRGMISVRWQPGSVGGLRSLLRVSGLMTCAMP